MVYTNSSEGSFISRAEEYGRLIEKGEHDICKGLSESELEARVKELEGHIVRRENESPGLKAYEWRRKVAICKGYLERARCGN